MKFEKPEYEFPVEDRDQAHRAGQPAGLYLLDGRWLIAAHWTAAERRLIERGALYVATLRFDGGPAGAGPGARPATPLAPLGAPRPLAASGRN